MKIEVEFKAADVIFCGGCEGTEEYKTQTIKTQLKYEYPFIIPKLIEETRPPRADF